MQTSHEPPENIFLGLSLKNRSVPHCIYESFMGIGGKAGGVRPRRRYAAKQLGDGLPWGVPNRRIRLARERQVNVRVVPTGKRHEYKRRQSFFGAHGLVFRAKKLMPENHLNFVYQLDGDVTEVDVFKLAPSLLALGELIQQSNRELYPDGPEVGVNVKPFREGSFIVDLTLFPASNFHQLLDLFTPHSLEQLKTLLEIIGLIGGGATAAGVGAVKALKFLRGKPKSVDEVRPGEYRLTTVDDRSITVDHSTHLLLQNPSITHNIFKVYGDPLESAPNIDDVRTYLKDDEGGAVKVERNEVSGLREYINPSFLPADERETVKEGIQNGVFLNPKRGAFGDDPKDWSFFRGDDVITATSGTGSSSPNALMVKCA